MPVTAEQIKTWDTDKKKRYYQYLKAKRERDATPQPTPQAAPTAARNIDSPAGTMKGFKALMDPLGRFLDYSSGIGRTAVAHTLPAMALRKLGGAELTPGEDILRALKGEAPQPSEYIQEAGIDLSPGQKLATDVYGGMIADPATYTGIGALGKLAQLKKIPKALKVALAPQRAAGKAVYKRAYSEADEAAAAAGKELQPSEIMYEAGAPSSLTSGGVKKNYEKVIRQKEAQRQPIIDMVDEAGVQPNLNRVEQRLKESSDQFLNEAAAESQDAGMQLLKEGKESVEAATKIAGKRKLTIGDILKNTAQKDKSVKHARQFGTSPPEKQRAKEVIANIWREEAREMAGEVGQKEAFIDLQAQIGTLKTPLKAVTKAAEKEGRQKLIKGFDVPKAMFMPVGLGVEKAIDIGRLSPFLSTVGRYAPPLTEQAARRTGPFLVEPGALDLRSKRRR